LIRYSPWLLHFNTGACNGCDIEVLAALTPLYDPERFGIKLTPSPRHADILIVTGAVTKKAAIRLKRIYDQMAEPKYVVAVGTCASYVVLIMWSQYICTYLDARQSLRPFLTV